MNERDREFLAEAARIVQEHLERARAVALCTHVNPDGDGIGAEICLHRFLRARSVPARIINTEPLAARYRFIDPEGTVEVFDASRHEGFLRGADLIFMLDNSSISRLGVMKGVICGSAATTICIDHHNVVDPFWKVNLVDQEASSTGELVFHLVKEMGGRVDRLAAQAAYVSLVTDTGHFRFSKTSPRAHLAAAEMVALGVDPPFVFGMINERFSAALIRLGGLALSGLQQDEGGGLAWIKVTHEQVLACGAEREDTSDIVNGLLAIEGVLIALMFKELQGRRVKISLRSKGNLDVNQVATQFGGGGHTNAAGAVIEGTLEDSIERILAPCRALLNATPEAPFEPE